MRLAPAAAGVLLGAAPASAATPEAWAELYRYAAAACIEATALSDPELVSETPTSFPGHLVYLVRGTWPQPHMKDTPPATFMCLYDIGASAAESVEMATEE